MFDAINAEVGYRRQQISRDWGHSKRRGLRVQVRAHRRLPDARPVRRVLSSESAMPAAPITTG